MSAVRGLTAAQRAGRALSPLAPIAYTAESTEGHWRGGIERHRQKKRGRAAASKKDSRKTAANAVKLFKLCASWGFVARLEATAPQLGATRNLQRADAI